MNKITSKKETTIMKSNSWNRFSLAVLVLLLGCVLIGPQSASADLNDGLAAYYPFNGNANDSSGNGNNGVVHGATLTADRFANPNAAYNFNGIDAYIEIASSSTLEMGYSDYTIAAWIKTTATSNNGRIFSKGSSGCLTGYMMRMGGPGSAYIHLENAYYGACSTFFWGHDPVNDGQWHFVVGVVDRDSSAKIYVDGQLDNVQTVNTASQNLDNGRNPWIGANDVGNFVEFFDGDIDDIRIYKRALSEDEIEQLYVIQDSCTQPPAGMVGWWPGDGNAEDVIGPHNGISYGGVSFAEGKAGQAFYFNGVDSYIVMQNSASLPLTGAMTVETWVNFSNYTSDDWTGLVTKNWDGGPVPFHLAYIKDSFDQGCEGIFPAGFFFGIDEGGGCNWHYVSSGDIADLDRWYHVAGTYDGTILKLYVDGELVRSLNWQGDIPTNNYPLSIGAASMWNGPNRIYGILNGKMDETTIYNRALSAEEIRSIYLAGSAGKCKPENRPPVANAGPDQVVEMTFCGGASVILDGSGSSDPDNDPFTYTWTENGTIITTGVNPTMALSYGSHTITLTIDDGKGGTATDDVVINVVDTTAPVLNVSVNPNVLWPPNHKYVTVTPAITVTDACAETVTVLRVSASSSEPDNGLGDGDTAGDIVENSDGTLSLRAERSGTGSGRVYTITYQATDIAGNATTTSVTVTVPHNQ